MVLRNTTRRSREELSPCRQPVAAGDAKKALSKFIAACRTTAAATTVALVVSAAGCMGAMPPQRLLGEPSPIQIDAQPDTQPAEEPEVRGEPVPLMGDIVSARITTDVIDE